MSRAIRALSAGGTSFCIAEIDGCPASTAPRHQIAADRDSQIKFRRHLATDISSSPAKFHDDRITGERTARCTSHIFGVGGRMSRAHGVFAT